MRCWQAMTFFVLDRWKREPGAVTSASPQTDRPSFLARKTFGRANYFLLFLAAAFLVALIPRGARRAVESNSNKAEDWLPKSYAESTDLMWFRDHFIGEQFALVSWDGCTLGNTEKLEQLSRKLLPSQNAIAHAPENTDLRERALWYKRVITGPSVLAQLVAPPLSLEYGEAVKRIEGALVGPVQRDARGTSLGNETRTTCLIVYLSPEATRDNRTMRRAIENISDIAANECAIDPDTIHMGGPPVDNITIDIEGERTLVRLASLAGLMGFALSYWCFRSVKITAIVFTIGVLSAGMSLAIVFYFGIGEVLLFGAERPRLGTVDAILMSMPAVVYVLGLSGAIHIVNYYRDARREKGLAGAAEAAVRHGWWPCTLAAVTTAVGLGSLATSDILPIKKFGLFTGLAVVMTVAILFLILPAFLHRFPLSEKLLKRQSGEHKHGHLPDWVLNLFGIVVGRNALTCLFWLVVTGVLAIGFARIGTSVQLLKLLDQDTDLIHDYAWLESHLGNLVPMELVITVPPERLRTADEHAEHDGRQYRMTMLERLEMIREIQFRIEAFPEISRAMSVATFTPSITSTGVSGTADRSGDYAINKSLEENREILLAGDYLRMEQLAESQLGSGRELWRVSARVEALGDPNLKDGDIDYGQFVEQLKSVVDPVLVAYQQRDMIVEQLHKHGKQLDGAQLCILYRTPDAAPEPILNAQESVLANLLLKSGVHPKVLPNGKRVRGVSFYNLTDFDTRVDEPQYLDKAINALSAQDALILVSASSDPTVKKLAEGGLTVIDVTNVPVDNSSAAVELGDTSKPRSIRSVYTGVVPLVYKTQRQLLISLKDSIFWATLLIAGIMVVLLRSAVGGMVSMLPNVFPIVVIFGTLGWLGIKVDIGIMMSASVALGVAVDDTIHFLTWFRRGVRSGLDRVQAVMLAYDRSALAMLQTTIIGGLGLAVFATSTFTPTQQFGYLMVSMLGAALVGDLLLLPALLAGPLGYYFGGKAPTMNVARLAEPGAFAAATKQLMEQLGGEGQLSEFSSSPASEPAPVKVPSRTTRTDAPQIVTPAATSSDDSHTEVMDGPHADLHARLRNLRRESPHGRISS
jgi:uncharacterized protein